MSVTLFWREHRLGQHLLLVTESGEEMEVGIIRRTPQGYDALAIPRGYAPGSSQRGLASIEEARAFVESFRPWEYFPEAQGLEVDPGVRPLPRA